MAEWVQTMWESVSGWNGWGTFGVLGAWVVTACLLVVGLAGCVIPVIPGHLVLLMAAAGHRLMLGREVSGVEWWTFVVLGTLMAASQVFEFFSGAAGARWFGGTKWGAAGALAGGLAGLFFMPFGLILGPLIGAYAFEAVFARQETRPAMASGVGSAVGTVAGMVVKLVVGVVMILWFIVDVIWIG